MWSPPRAVHPRRLDVAKHRVVGGALCVLDVLFHQLPLWILLWRIGRTRRLTSVRAIRAAAQCPGRMDVVGTLFLLAVYALVRPDWPERYGLRGEDVLVLLFAVPLVAAMLFGWRRPPR